MHTRRTWATGAVHAHALIPKFVFGKKRFCRKKKKNVVGAGKTGGDADDEMLLIAMGGVG